MKSIICIIILSYAFLLIYSGVIVEEYDYNDPFYLKFKTNTTIAQKAANFCLKYYNEKHKNETYTFVNLTFAMNETEGPDSLINLMFTGNNGTNPNINDDFQGIYENNKKKNETCDITKIPYRSQIG
ncbi:Hypothetical protein SRAE_1000300700 [Strongyloides ratti]|uniref:Proteinase inhibitor I25, cystatin domain-containing protein n=1 Tax=Strongyloides ratti TaxID=34506 RepID=A0A090MX37_STRRB|nr:Hypothetical protein SRAE_1000300700 [Strongyloides ratti]CEF64754.1 Hypothetical protein SRAE_1000300700 [Strongyloides ratti]